MSKRCCVIMLFHPLLHNAQCTPERNSIPVYMVDTPVVEDFSMSCCLDSDTESLLSAIRCISISSG